MINILLPALGFMIALGLVMVLVGVLQRKGVDKLSSKLLSIMLFIPFVLMQVVGYFVRAGYFPADVYPYALLLYFIVPFGALLSLKKASIYKASVVSLVFLASAFSAGASVAFFINANS